MAKLVKIIEIKKRVVARATEPVFILETKKVEADVKHRVVERQSPNVLPWRIAVKER